MRGGSSTAVHAIDVDDRAGRRHRLVLRRFIRPNFQGPELPRQESAALTLLDGSGVPTPRLIGIDAVALSCDVPALLMTRLPGRVELQPASMRDWLSKLAALLPSIHELAGSAEIQTYVPYTKASDFAAPPWGRPRAVWAKVLALARSARPRTRRRFIHRDYHPTNVLWSRGKVSGVIDWVNASMGPPQVDVAHCRVNLVALCGVEVADQFLDAYLALVDQPRSAWHPYWDAVAVMDSGLATEPHVFTGWEGISPPGLTAEVVAARMDEFAASIAGRC
jgi:aminoglycoside phosphotransferase (APT) family kinase protein